MVATVNASTSAGVVITPDNSGVLAFQSSSATALTIDASQNVGIGTTSPSYKLQVNATASADGVYITSSSVDGTPLYLNNSSASGRQFRLLSTGSGNGPGAGTLGVFDGTANAYRMIIDSNGVLLVNTTTAANAGRMKLNFAGATQNGIVIESDTASASGSMLFKNTNGVVGNITTTSSSTAFSTSSDYRLKENITPMMGALAKVAQLKPVTYKWKIDGADGEGFIAHELAEVKPHAVIGEKDAVDADGNPKYQGIDTSFLVATLTAAIQELKAINDTLTARIVALENR